MSGIDLHVHSTASDGECSPREVVSAAKRACLDVIALTDHDTLGGVREATTAGREQGVRVIAGCEFSVRAPWGEMHLLAYFLPSTDEPLSGFLGEQRARRAERAQEIVRRLNRVGVGLAQDEVLAQAGGEAIGRPHVARALIARGAVPDVQAAFQRYLGTGRVAFVPKELPTIDEVTALVRAAAGVSSAAHLGAHATRSGLQRLKARGVDGVEVLHPSHDALTVERITRLARELELLSTGGTDWHGPDHHDDPRRAALGALDVPAAWLEALERTHAARINR